MDLQADLDLQVNEANQVNVDLQVDLDRPEEEVMLETEVKVDTLASKDLAVPPALLDHWAKEDLVESVASLENLAHQDNKVAEECLVYKV